MKEDLKEYFGYLETLRLNKLNLLMVKKNKLNF